MFSCHPNLILIVQNNCSIECSDYIFDDSFWIGTVTSEWDLVCDNQHLPTLAKMIFFSG